MNEMILSIHDLNYQYGTKKVLKNVDMKIYKGSIYGLIGENGAGKSTLLKVISHALPVSKEHFDLSYFKDEETFFEKTTFLIEDAPFFSSMTGLENLRFFLNLKHLEIDEFCMKWIEAFEMQEAVKKKVSSYSTGMRQRLSLLLCFCSRPEFMVLDEPLNGLDPSGIVFLRKMLLKLNQEEHTTILISSHILSELAMIVDHVGFLHQGVMLEESSMQEMVEKCSNYLTLQCRSKDVEELVRILKQDFQVNRMEQVNATTFYVNDEIDVEEFQRYLGKKDIYLLECKKIEGSLEDYFLNLLKEGN